ncbi:cyclin-dependent kinase-like 3 [Plectropomus leopardus]|uniref:cyclin-dependent kinase-like 3 n=1 Tax=Plectropomus leopardus TaxID=160734 RepID=UPI001C4BC93D|nr:cyclin-dependent kinase-like 3 [Plectropomus leopardus]
MERYESLGLVGEGSYGTVLKCRHRDSGRLVAIKKFMDSDDDKTVKKIALREIKLLKQLRHDNLVNLVEVWKRRRRWYLVFEFVERTLLDDLEQNPSGLDLNTSRQYLYQILRAVTFCHQQNIIHRDIKPENILISQGGVVKMCDFGFARTMTSPAEGGVYTDYVATRWYRAPELLVGDTKYGKPVDVWAVGCLLLEMLTGQPLFPGDSDLDQIYHIVRCFGNMTAHHQEMFYRNPVFSGVRLPECSGKVPLEQRFPTITPAALDLAQSCLRMDPEERAQCSELLEHPLFTQDSFHIRFLDELNVKIQKDHRENSTLPKITKTPRRERGEGDDKNRKSKDKSQPEDVNDKVTKERERKEEDKMEKTKGKQPLKISKTIRNPSEPSVSVKQSKTLGKGKPGKATGLDLRKEPEIPKSTKTLISDSLEATKTATDLKEVASPETKEVILKTRDSGLYSSYSENFASGVTSKLEPSQDSGKRSNNLNTKVPRLSKNSTTDHPNRSSTPKASLKSEIHHTEAHLTQKIGKISTTEYSKGVLTGVTSKTSTSDQVETSLTLQMSQESSSDHTEVAAPSIPSCKTSTISAQQTSCSTMDTEQKRTSECPKVIPLNLKPSKTTSNLVPKMTKNSTTLSISISKTLSSDLSRQSSTVFTEASLAHSSTTLPKGTSNLKLAKTGSFSDSKPINSPCEPNKPSRSFQTERDFTEVSIAANAQCPILNPAENDTEISKASVEANKDNPETSQPSSVHLQSTLKSKITPESQMTSTSMPNDAPKTVPSGETAIPTILKVSDKENREDSALPVSISARTKSFVNQTSKVPGVSNIEQKNNSSEAEPNIKSLKPPQSKSLTGEPKTKPGSFSNHSKSTTMTLKSQKTTFPTEARKKRDSLERDGTTNISAFADSTSFTSTATPDHKASTRSSIFHNMDTVDINDFAASVLHSSPPPPPPPPSSTPQLLPPSSTPLIHPFSVHGPATSDHLSLGSFHPGAHSHRCSDKPRHHGGIYSRLSSHITGPLSAQVSEKSLICERSLLSDRCNLGNSGGTATKKKPDIHFPDLRGSVLPELKGREGKHNKGTSKDQRKDKQPVPPSEPQQHGHNSTDTQTP